MPDLALLHAPSVYDFRSRSILYGPVSDLVPSTPVFEMYPIGFTTMAEYLERHGLKVRIVNLAVRMLQDPSFDVERAVGALDACAFGIDLHWLPHAHGAIEVARLVKRLHPGRPVILGGFSASHFHAELVRRDEVDFVLRGDSTERPLLDLVTYLRSGGSAHPATASSGARILARVPNLAWRDAEGLTHANEITYSPENLDDLLLDYTYVLRAVVRYRDLASFIPFRAWMRYPITAALSVRGCKHNCVTCGGSACAYRRLHGRARPAFRQPEQLASDIRRIGTFSHGPVFVLGDLRQAGDRYADRFLEAVSGYKKPVIIELFDAPPKGYFRKVAAALPNFTVEISLESHDDKVRRAFGRPYDTATIEASMDQALDAGCRRLDLFFMIGLRHQSYDSVMDTVDYCGRLLERYDRAGEHRAVPFIAPMAPFLDPGSNAFTEPLKYGYRLHRRTLEDHRAALLEPSWKYVLNYETQWMDRHAIVAATYEASRRMNRLKGEHGVIPDHVAAATDARIAKAVDLSARIDGIVAISDASERQRRLLDIKAEVDGANTSTVCDKRELELPLSGLRVDVMRAARLVARDWLSSGMRKLASRIPPAVDRSS